MPSCGDSKGRLKPDPTDDIRRMQSPSIFRRGSPVGSAFRRTLVVSAICIGAATVFAQGSNAAKLFHEAEEREAVLRTEINTRKAGAPATPLL